MWDSVRSSDFRLWSFGHTSAATEESSHSYSCSPGPNQPARWSWTDQVQWKHDTTWKRLYLCSWGLFLEPAFTPALENLQQPVRQRLNTPAELFQISLHKSTNRTVSAATDQVEGAEISGKGKEPCGKCHVSQTREKLQLDWSCFGLLIIGTVKVLLHQFVVGCACGDVTAMTDVEIYLCRLWFWLWEGHSTTSGCSGLWGFCYSAGPVRSRSTRPSEDLLPTPNTPTGGHHPTTTGSTGTAGHQGQTGHKRYVCVESVWICLSESAFIYLRDGCFQHLRHHIDIQCRHGTVIKTVIYTLCVCVCACQVFGLWWITQVCAWTLVTLNYLWCPTIEAAWRSTSLEHCASPRASCRCWDTQEDVLSASPALLVRAQWPHSYTETHMLYFFYHCGLSLI